MRRLSTRRREWLVIVAAAFAVYLGSYAILSATGEYVPATSGETRWFNGLGVTDIRIWQPRFCHWHRWKSASGEMTFDANPGGYLYLPLILIDRAILHPTEKYF